MKLEVKWKTIFEYISIEGQTEKFRNEYYDVIAKCHVGGASTIFIEFMLSQIDKVLEDIPYTSKTLMEMLGLKSKEGFRRNYLRPAIDMGLIQMTIPDRKNSKNQRYIKI